MLNKVKTLKDYKLHSFDGEIGNVKDLYFDDQYWTIRYLIANTGNWLTGRQVLISPYALMAVNKEKQYITVNLAKDQIENSPSLESDKPVSQQFEESYYGYYKWPLYWGGPDTWGQYPYVEHNPTKWKENGQGKRAWNPNLRSIKDVSGYDIQALDGTIGHVEDFIIDDETWTIRYLIVDTRNWWPGKKILVSPLWIERISWDESKVFVNLLCDTIKQSPEYTDESLLTRNYETGLHQHYKRQGYWMEEPTNKEHDR
jgi:uncharacterized protein YrrD